MKLAIHEPQVRLAAVRDVRPAAVRPKHLPAYLDELVVRFNRRTARSISHRFARLIEHAVQNPAHHLSRPGCHPSLTVMDSQLSEFHQKTDPARKDRESGSLTPLPCRRRFSPLPRSAAASLI
jgi:hypothetical protein